MTVKDQPMAEKTSAETFTWRIGNFSELKATELNSDSFLAGGHKWTISVYPKGNRCRDHLSVYLSLADSETICDGKSVTAHFSLTVVNQIDTAFSLQEWFKHDFHEHEDGWGRNSFVLLRELLDPGKGFLVSDTITIEAEVSTVRPLLSETTKALSSQSEVDTTVKLNGTTPSSPFAPSSVQLTSRSLMAQLSSLNISSSTSCGASSPGGITCSKEGGYPFPLQQQREKLVMYLRLPLQLITQTENFDDVTSTALELAEHSTDIHEKTFLKDLVSRLSEFKQTIPSSLSTIETSRSLKSSLAKVTKDLEEKLVIRKAQLSSLEGEVSRLGDQGIKLEAEIQQLSAQKDEILRQRNSTTIKLEQANVEASDDLEELKKRREESKRVVEDCIRAQEKLAECRARWYLFKEDLPW